MNSINVSSIDVGFDLRVQKMKVEVPENAGVFFVTYNDFRGNRVVNVKCENRNAAVALLLANGYSVK
jgi:hypothetical protein